MKALQTQRDRDANKFNSELKSMERKLADAGVDYSVSDGLLSPKV